MDPTRPHEGPVDGQARALASIAAAVAVGAAPSTFRSLVNGVLAAGVTADQIVSTMLAVGPIVGSARLVRAAPALARAVGYDVDVAFEELA